MPIPTVTALPDPPTRGTDTGATFSSKAAAFNDALKDTFVGELNSFATDLVDAAASANYSATSTTSNAIGTGSKSFTVEDGKSFVAGEWLVIADAAAPTTNYMFGQVTSYNSGTGALVFDSQRVGGSGTKTSWFIGLSGPQGEGGDTLPSFAGNANKVLQLNSGETAAQWTALGYTQIGTSSPSGSAGPVTFSSIPQTYSELFLTFNGSTSATNLTFSISPDGSSWATATTVSDSATTFTGVIRIPRYTGAYGVLLKTEQAAPSASPSINGVGSWSADQLWSCTAGIQAVRFAVASGTVTGTFTLYGKL